MFELRYGLEKRYYEWLRDNSIDKYRVKDCPFNVIVFLESIGVIDEDKANKYLESEERLDKVKEQMLEKFLSIAEDNK